MENSKKFRRSLEHTRKVLSIDTSLIHKAIHSLIAHEPIKGSIISLIVTFNEPINNATTRQCLIPIQLPIHKSSCLIVDKYKEWSQLELPTLNKIYSIQKLRKEETLEKLKTRRVFILSSIAERVKAMIGKEVLNGLKATYVSGVEMLKESLSSTVLNIKNGNEFSIEVGSIDMSSDEVSKNVLNTMYVMIANLLVNQKKKTVKRIALKTQSTIDLNILK